MDLGNAAASGGQHSVARRLCGSGTCLVVEGVWSATEEDGWMGVGVGSFATRTVEVAPEFASGTFVSDAL